MSHVGMLATDLEPVFTAVGVAVAAVAAVVAWIARGDSQTANKIAQSALGAEVRQASAAERAMAWSVRPALVGNPKPQVPYTYRTEPNEEDAQAKHGDFVIRISFPIRNVGVGPAMMHDAYLETPTRGQVVHRSGNGGVVVKVDKPVISSGEAAYFHCVIPQLTPNAIQIRKDMEDGGFRVYIRYTDIAEGHRTLTAMRWKILPGGDLVMRDLNLYLCDKDWTASESPFASYKD